MGAWAGLQPEWSYVGDTWAGIFEEVPWPISVSVSIDGRDYTGNAVGLISVRRGRDSVYDQTQAGFASVELLDVDGLVTFQVGEPLTITLLNTLGDAIPLFSGTVSDWDSEVTRIRADVLVTYRVQAVGPLASLNRRTIFFDGRAGENDGARVEAALTAALGTAFVDPTIIDAGVFNLAALGTADAGYSALQVAQDAASDTEGVLFETPDGRIGYADSDRRLGTTDFRQISWSLVSVDGVRVSSQLADVTNEYTVEFEGGAVTRSSPTSIDVFGLLAKRQRTRLADLSAAEQVADLFIQRHETPSRQLGRLEFNLRGVPGIVRDFLLGTNTNDGIVLTGIPNRLGFTRFNGFVEGIDLNLNPDRASVGLLVSDEVLSTGDIRWSVVPAAVTWATVEPADLEWQNARSL
jgi:hypothetical protein